MAVKNYDPKDILLVIAGVPVTGLADGTFVTAARENDAFATTTGADGEGARSQSNDKSGTVVVTVLQTSQANDVLSAAHQVDEANGDGVFPVLVKDLNGTTLVSAETAWVQKVADVEFAREISEREWTIASAELNIFAGGALTV